MILNINHAEARILRQLATNHIEDLEIELGNLSNQTLAYYSCLDEQKRVENIRNKLNFVLLAK